MTRPQEPSEVAGQKKKAKRRSLLRAGALVVLGASVLIQPSGGVLGLTSVQEKKEDITAKGPKTTKTAATTNKGGKKGGSGPKGRQYKGGKKKGSQEPKKE